MNKKPLRRRMGSIRRAVSPTEAATAELAILSHLKQIELKGPILIYVSFRSELPTRTLLTAFPDVAVPRITGEGIMEAAKLTELVEGEWGIPTSTGDVVSPRTILLPGLAFDPTGARLGYGGGFYDRYLQQHPQALTIGLAFDAQIIPEVPCESHDERLDRVLTPSGWIR